MEKEIMIKEEIPKVELSKSLPEISKALKKVMFIKNKMNFILNYLEIKIIEDKENSEDIIAFYRELENEIFLLYSSDRRDSFPEPIENKMICTFSLEVTTDKLADLGISFLDPIDTVLASILYQVNLIKLKNKE